MRGNRCRANEQPKVMHGPLLGTAASAA